jgi:hypothetical protein
VKGRPIRVIDTPGISWATDAPAAEEDSDSAENIENIRARDILMRSKGRIDRLKDPIVAGELSCRSVVEISNAPVHSPTHCGPLQHRGPNAALQSARFLRR